MSVSKVQLQRDLSSFFDNEMSKELSLQELIIFSIGKNYNHLTFDFLYGWLNRHFRKIPSVMAYLPPAKTISLMVRKLVDNGSIEYRYINRKYALRLTMKGLAQFDILEQHVEL